MAKKHTFLTACFSESWRESYQKLQLDEQKATDKVLLRIVKGQTTPGDRIKPIQPSKYYNEARISDGDRIIHRIDNGVVYFVDIVPHDLISKYAQPRKNSP